jgi:hypothetical protein
MRGCLWRRRFPPVDGNRDESTRTTGGRPANSGVAATRDGAS